MTLPLARAVRHSVLLLLVGLAVIMTFTGCQAVSNQPVPNAPVEPITTVPAAPTEPVEPTPTPSQTVVALPKTVTAKVIRVVDGDTIVVQSSSELQPTTGAGSPEPGESAAAGTQHTVRLLGIDAPEMNFGKNMPPECGAQAATDHLAELLPKGTGVTITYDQPPGVDRTDRFDRSLAYVSTAAIPDVNRTQAADGFASAWIPKSATQPERWNDYLSAAELPKSRPVLTVHRNTARASAANSSSSRSTTRSHQIMSHDWGTGMTTVYSDHELLSKLRRLALGEPTLGRRTYDQRRNEHDPSPHLFTHRFGAWNKALVVAGLGRTMQPVQLQDTTTKWAEPQMLAALRDCRSETGSLTVRGYEAWRLNAAHPRLNVPPATSIRARFGQWSAASALAA